MAVKFQDYYEILGVPRTATQDEIRKSYRKLARQYHPDLSKESGAEEKFKQIAEAYEVLRDPETRKKYDQLGRNWKMGQDFTPPPGWEGVQFDFGGQSGQFEGFSDFFSSLFGGGPREGFPGGGGFRSRRQRARRGANREVQVTIALEEAFHGVTNTYTMETPEGQKTYEIKIPPGTIDGSTIRLAGQGGKGSHGGSEGDLLLRVSVAPHPVYRLEGHDVHMTLPIAPWEAVLGANISVQTLDGKVELTIPSGTQSGQKLRLRGRGFPHRGGAPGDLYVETRIVVPRQASSEERELFERLARVSSFRPRPS